MGRDRALMDFAMRQQTLQACLRAVSLRCRRASGIQWDVVARSCHLWIWIPGDGELQSCHLAIWCPQGVVCVLQWMLVSDCVKMDRWVVVQVVSRRRRRVNVIRLVCCRCVIVNVKYVMTGWVDVKV